MKILSLFDGISCARVALERAKIPVEVYYASEVDKYAIEISRKNYPNIIQLGTVVGLKLEEEIDLLIGGSPCQDLSIAKKGRQGLDGERSSLFWEYVRILEEVKPKYFILENVNSMPKEAKQLITETLGVEPIMINAALVSAQNRKRLFWTNIPNVTQPEDKGILLKDILEENVDEKYHIKNVRNIVRKSEKSMQWDASGKGYNSQQDRANSINSKSATVPYNNPKNKVNVFYGEIVRRTTPIEKERLQCLPDNYTYGILDSRRESAIGNAFNVDVVAHILTFLT